MADPLYDPNTEVLARGRDGQLRAVPIAEADQVAASGGQILEGDDAYNAAYEAARYAESQTAGGQVRTVAGAVGSGILAAPSALFGTTGERTFAKLAAVGEDEGYAERAEQQLRYDAEANPTLQFIGSTVGNTATGVLGGMGVAAAGGRLGAALGSDALAANLATGGTLSRLGAKALTAAPSAAGVLTENALGGIGAANEQAFLENRELAADEVAASGLIGAGLGMGLGVGARGLGYAGQKVQQRVLQSLPEGGLGSIAERSAFDAVAQGAPKTKALKAVKSEADARLIGRRALDEGLIEAEQQGGAAAALDLTRQKMRERGEVMNRIAEESAGSVDNAWLVEKVLSQAEELSASSGTRVSKALARKIRGELEPTFAKLKRGEEVTFADIQRARTEIREGMPTTADGATRRAYNKLYDSLGETLEEAVQRADDAGGRNGSLVAEWKDANRAYRELATAKSAYAGKLAKEQGPRPLLNFSDSQAGQGAAVLGSLVTGNVGTGALLGLGTAAAKKAFREKGAGWIAQAADQLAKRGEIPSVTKLLAASSTARRELGRYAVGQLVQKAGRSAAESEPAGFAYGALANYSDPKRVSADYASATAALQAAQGDAQGMAERASSHLGALAAENPELALAAQMRMARAVDYLRDMQPASAPRSVLAVRMGTESNALPPSQAQISWLKRYRATVDPSVIYGEIARGYINPETVETLETLYPSYLADVRMSALGAINESGAQLPYSKRLALDNLFGGNGQVEPTRRPSVQERLEQANQATLAATSPPAPSSRKAPEIARFDVTTSDRLMST